MSFIIVLDMWENRLFCNWAHVTCDNQIWPLLIIFLCPLWFCVKNVYNLELRQTNMTQNNMNKILSMVKQLWEVIYFLFLNCVKVIIQAGDLRPNALDAVEINNYCLVFYCHFLVSNVVEKIILYLNRCHRLLAIVPRSSG